MQMHYFVNSTKNDAKSKKNVKKKKNAEIVYACHDFSFLMKIFEDTASIKFLKSFFIPDYSASRLVSKVTYYLETSIV